MSRVAVSGARGYLGSRVIAKLAAQGIEALPLVRKQRNETEVACDLTNSAEIGRLLDYHNVDRLIHCAEIVPKNIDQYNDSRLYEKNITILENVTRLDVGRLVYCSSMVVYGDNATGMVDESAIPTASSAYAESKLQCEKWMQDNFTGELVIARLPGLFGGNRKTGLIYNSIKLLLEKKLPSIDSHPVAWSAMHVEDGAEMLVRMATYPAQKNYIFNTGYGVPQSVYRFIREIMSLMSIDDLELPNIEDNWLCLNIDRQLQHLGSTPHGWQERLAQEIKAIGGS